MKIKMKIRIMDSNTRCPYCGELAILPPVKWLLRRVPKKRCEVCGGLYTFQYNMAAILVWCIIGMIFFIYIIDFHDILSFLWYLLLVIMYVYLNPVYWSHCPLKPLEKIRWGICSEYEVILKIASKDRKYFKKNMIYPLCFFDENSHSISKYCCAKVIEIQKTRGELYCVISTLPYGEKINESFLDCNFNLFFDKRVIGTGKILQ